MNNSLVDDRLREECGVFGVFGHPDSAQLTVLGLHALQHRGQEAVGIVTFDGTKFQSEKRLGLVGDNFTKQPIIEKLFQTLKGKHSKHQKKLKILKLR